MTGLRTLFHVVFLRSILGATLLGLSPIVLGGTEKPLGQIPLKDLLWDEVGQKLKAIPEDSLLLPVKVKVSSKAYQETLGLLPPTASCDLAIEGVRRLLRVMGPSLFVISSKDPEFTILQNAFDPEAAPQSTAVQLGVSLKAKGRRIYVAAVLEGSPAALAGLIPGDEVVSVEGKPPRVDLGVVHESSVYQESSPKLKVARQHISTWVVRRLAGHVSSEAPSEAPSEVPHVGLRTLKLAASGQQTLDDLISGHIKGSVRQMKTASTNLIYAHLAATHRPRFYEDFKTSVNSLLVEDIPLRPRPPSQAHKTTGLIIDLRGPYGPVGASFADLLGEPHWFFSPSSSKPLRPLAVLIDETTMGGREWLAWMLREKAGAVLVGSPSGGVWTSSQWVPLQSCPGSLMIPQGPVKSPLPEGVGLAPDLKVDPALVYQAGRDPVIQAATEELLRKIRM